MLSVLLLTINVFIVAVAGGWSTATLSQARGYISSTSVGSKALFAGGSNDAGVSAVVDIYDATSGLWTAASLSVARSSLAATSVGSKALFAGGSGASGYLNTVDIYDVNSGAWTTATLSQARSDLAATSAGNVALFAGGIIANSGTFWSGVVDLYNVNTGLWTTATLSQARYDLTATTVGSKALFAGGNTDGFHGYSAVVDIYDSSSGLWSTATLSQARYGPIASTAGSIAIFSGGQTLSSPYTTTVVDLYNAATNQWSASSLSQARFYATSTSVNHTCFIAGGAPPGSTSGTALVEAFNTISNQVTVSALSQARWYLASASLGTKAIFAGGVGAINGGTTYYSTVDIFDTATGGGGFAPITTAASTATTSTGMASSSSTAAPNNMASTGSTSAGAVAVSSTGTLPSSTGNSNIGGFYIREDLVFTGAQCTGSYFTHYILNGVCFLNAGGSSQKFNAQLSGSLELCFYTDSSCTTLNFCNTFSNVRLFSVRPHLPSTDLRYVCVSLLVFIRIPQGVCASGGGSMYSWPASFPSYAKQTDFVPGSNCQTPVLGPWWYPTTGVCVAAGSASFTYSIVGDTLLRCSYYNSPSCAGTPSCTPFQNGECDGTEQFEFSGGGPNTIPSSTASQISAAPKLNHNKVPLSILIFIVSAAYSILLL